MKIVFLAIVAILLAAAAWAEDFQCSQVQGCIAYIAEDGELESYVFRRGDMVSTEAGWIVSTDDGWVKVRTNGMAHWGSGNVYVPVPVSMSLVGLPLNLGPRTAWVFNRRGWTPVVVH